MKKFHYHKALDYSTQINLITKITWKYVMECFDRQIQPAKNM